MHRESKSSTRYTLTRAGRDALAQARQGYTLTAAGTAYVERTKQQQAEQDRRSTDERQDRA